MKKVIIAIVSLIYVVAIIVVAFLGIRAEVNPASVITEVESIVLDEVKGTESGEYQYHYDEDNDNPDSVVYEVLTRPAEDIINGYGGSDEKGNLWNIGETRISYIVKIHNFNYIYDNDNWANRQDKASYQIRASVLPENASFQDLTYAFTYSESDVTLSEDGLLKFEKLTQVRRFNVIIKSSDNSNKQVVVRFLVQSYQ